MPREPNLIIIADDDRDDSLYLLTALLSLPLELTIVTVPNGERLIKILEFVSPHLIFLDINMPRRNGFEALKHIRSKKNSAQPTIIMCSTSSSSSDLKMSQELGADLYVIKPNNIKTLNKMVEEIFRRDWSSNTNERIPDKFLLSHVQ